MTTPPWIERFEQWIQRDFCSFDKDALGETHGWLFCWNGEQDDEMPFDCACNLTAARGEEMKEDCGCICHKRLKEIENFFAAEIKKEVEQARQEGAEEKMTSVISEIESMEIETENLGAKERKSKPIDYDIIGQLQGYALALADLKDRLTK